MFLRDPNKSWFDQCNVPQNKIVFRSSEELKRLVDRPELRLKDDPAAMYWIHKAIDDPQDSDCQEKVQQILQKKESTSIASGDSFWGNYPTEGQVKYPFRHIKIGKTPTGIEIGMGYEQLPLNTLIIGPTGKGKTTALKGMLIDDHLLTKVCFIMLVKKPEWRGFLLLPPKYSSLTRILQVRDMAIGFSQIPGEKVNHAIWHNDLSRFTGQTYDRIAAHRLMNETLHELSSQFPSGCYPTLKQLIAAIESMKIRLFSRRADLKESIISCLTDLALSVGDIFEYSSSTFLNELFSHPGLTVIEALTLPPEHLGFLTTYLTRWIYCKRLYEGAGSMPIVFVIDDATVNVCHARDKSNPSGIAPIPESMIMGQALNMGYILLVHDYSSISELIRQNAGTLIIMGLPGENSYVLKNHLDISDEQIQTVKAPPLGQAVFINRGVWSKPVRINIDKPDIPETCPDTLLCQSARAFLSMVKTMPPYQRMPAVPPKPSDAGSTPAPTSTGPALNAKEMDCLILAAQTSPLPLSPIYHQLGLTNSEGRRVINKHVSLGLIILHALATGRRGGRVQIIEVTESGRTLLDQNGHRRPIDNGQGSWLHKVSAALIEAEGKSQQDAVTFEVHLEGCRMDVLRVNSKTYQRTFYNIGLSTPDYEAQAIIKFFTTSAAVGADFVLVTETKAFADKVINCLKKTAEGRNVMNRFTTRLIGSFVKV